MTQVPPARPRKPGAMVGEIWIAPDFDTLPGDIAAAMGAVGEAPPEG